MEPEDVLIFWFIILIFVFILCIYLDIIIINAVVLSLTTAFLFILPFIRFGFDREKLTHFQIQIIDSLEVIYVISIFVIYLYVSRTTLRDVNIYSKFGF